MTVPDASFLNFASSNDVMTFSMWVKKYDIAQGSAFWGVSPSSSGTERGFQAHFPWSDDNIYFDTSGCCDGSLERISAAITGFQPYIDFGNTDNWWTNWHHLVAFKNLSDKQIWIDGQMFLEGTSTSPLATDFNVLYLGYDLGDNVAMHGLVDDFAVYSSALSPSDIAALYGGTAPDAISAASSLLAYWPFDDAPALTAKPTISIALVKGKVVITYTGTLYSSPLVSGPYTAVTGATSPYSPTSSGVSVFYRAHQ